MSPIMVLLDPRSWPLAEKHQRSLRWPYGPYQSPRSPSEWQFTLSWTCCAHGHCERSNEECFPYSTYSVKPGDSDKLLKVQPQRSSKYKAINVWSRKVDFSMTSPLRQGQLPQCHNIRVMWFDAEFRPDVNNFGFICASTHEKERQIYLCWHERDRVCCARSWFCLVEHSKDQHQCLMGSCLSPHCRVYTASHAVCKFACSMQIPCVCLWHWHTHPHTHRYIGHMGGGSCRCTETFPRVETLEGQTLVL